VQVSEEQRDGLKRVVTFIVDSLLGVRDRDAWLGHDAGVRGLLSTMLRQFGKKR
jgi:hypothetical protein